MDHTSFFYRYRKYILSSPWKHLSKIGMKERTKAAITASKEIGNMIRSYQLLRQASRSKRSKGNSLSIKERRRSVNGCEETHCQSNCNWLRNSIAGRRNGNICPKQDTSSLPMELEKFKALSMEGLSH